MYTDEVSAIRHFSTKATLVAISYIENNATSYSLEEIERLKARSIELFENYLQGDGKGSKAVATFLQKLKNSNWSDEKSFREFYDFYLRETKSDGEERPKN